MYVGCSAFLLSSSVGKENSIEKNGHNKTPTQRGGDVRKHLCERIGVV